MAEFSTLANLDVMEPLMVLSESLGNPFKQAYFLYIRQFQTPPVSLSYFLTEYVIHHCQKRKVLPIEFIKKLLIIAEGILETYPNVVKITDKVDNIKIGDLFECCDSTIGSSNKVTVVGDIHGQFDDLLKILQSEGVGGNPSPENILIFNGDLVDRGDMSVETIAVVLLLKVLNKDCVHILRGNHETVRANLIYGFNMEVVRKYSLGYTLFPLFKTVFQSLPLAALIEERVFVVHGGIGPCTSAMSIKQIDQICRSVEPELGTAIWELLWSDPVRIETGFLNTRAMANNGFSASITESFLTLNNLQLLVRSHQECLKGYKYSHHGQCLTVFSAANYTGDGKNFGAVAQFGLKADLEPTIVCFAAEHYKMKEANE